MPLPKVRCKWDHMPKAQILLSSKCVWERKTRGQGEKKRVTLSTSGRGKESKNAKSMEFTVTQVQVGMTRYLPLGREIHTGWCSVVNLGTFYESLTYSEMLQLSLSVLESIMIHQPGWKPSSYISVALSQFEEEYSQLSDYVRKDIGMKRIYLSSASSIIWKPDFQCDQNGLKPSLEPVTSGNICKKSLEILPGVTLF